MKYARADRYCKLTYNKTSRNFSPVMAMAAKTTIVQTARQEKLGDIDPEIIVTPGIFVDRVVTVTNPVHESELVRAGSTYP